LDATKAVRGPIETTTLPFQIGGQPKGPWNLNGRVDELSLYHRALTPSEIKSIYLSGGAGKCPVRQQTNLPPTGLIGWWSGERDLVNSIGDGALGAPNTRSFAPGKVGTAFYFDSKNRPLRMTNDSLPSSPTELTLECWVNAKQYPTNHWQPLVAKSHTIEARSQFALGLANRGGRWVWRALLDLTTAKAIVDGSATIGTSTWYHVTMTYDRTNLHLYHNGVLDSSTTTQGRIMPADFPMLIGGGDSVAEGFVGRLDEVGLYDRALSSGEIAAHTLAGQAGKSFTAPRPSTRDLRKWFFGEQKAKSSSPPAVESR
jgi:hypothetical protein